MSQNNNADCNQTQNNNTDYDQIERIMLKLVSLPPEKLAKALENAHKILKGETIQKS